MADTPVLLKTPPPPFPIPRGQLDTLPLRLFIRKQKPLKSYSVILTFAVYLFIYKPFIQGYHLAFIQRCCTHTTLQYFRLINFYFTINQLTVDLRT